ncbi:MAG TPA: RidA family protein [Balneolaceae bacterium]|nr:RidA family protein [Balneolaceae bacterium]
MKRIVSTEKAPKAIGPYSQAVSAGGFLFCSGQIPIDPKTGEVLQGDITEQTQCVMNHLKAVLEAGDSSFNHVVKCTIFLADMQDFKAVNEVYKTYFDEEPPAREAVAVRELPRGVGVEISCIALV